MQRLKDKYGRGSAVVNVAGFVDLEPGEGGETMEINRDTDSERTPRGETAPLQNQVSQLKSRIAYYVGDGNRTKPTFLARSEVGPRLIDHFPHGKMIRDIVLANRIA